MYSITDINECNTNHGGCHANATCTNTIGSHICKCFLGYDGNGTKCTGKQLCYFIIIFIYFCFGWFLLSLYYLSLQIGMSVTHLVMDVMWMLAAIILMVVTNVNVILDFLEMGRIAMVFISIFFPFIAFYMTSII